MGSNPAIEERHGEHRAAPRRDVPPPVPRRRRQGARPAFKRKTDAQRWLDEVTATLVTGMYVDPKAGRVTLSAFYAAWSAPPRCGLPATSLR